MTNFKSIMTMRNLCQDLHDKMFERGAILMRANDENLTRAADHLDLAQSALFDVEFHLSEAALYEKKSRE